jgi:hypothetical protein
MDNEMENMLQEKIRRSSWRLLTRCSTNGITCRLNVYGRQIIFSTVHTFKPGRDGLFNLIRSAPATLEYEPGVIAADGAFVIVHGRFSGHGRPANWIAADILRIKDAILVEH